MKVTLIRHGKTAGNALHRYIGKTDEPLSPEGRAEAERCGKDFSLKRVYVTPLIRTQETAKVLFPNAEQIAVDDLSEIDFGVFENKSAEDMKDFAPYREWVDSMCKAPCPGGESFEHFAERVINAFLKTALEDGGDCTFVVHGGVIMILMSHLAEEKRSFYDWYVNNLCGYTAELVCEDGEWHLKGAGRRELTIDNYN